MSAKRAELLIRWNDGDVRNEYMDIAVINTHSVARMNHTAPSSALQNHATRKRDLYEQICKDRRASFRPLILPADGGGVNATGKQKSFWNNSLTPLLRKLKRVGKRGRPSSHFS